MQNDTEIIFVKTGHDYQSYTDFFKLVELSGFQTVPLHEVDVSRYCVYIVAPHNGEWNPHIDNQNDKARNAHLVLWNIERPSGSKGSVGEYAKSNRELIYKRYIDDIWVSDRRLAKEIEMRFVVLGSHKGLGEPSSDKRYSFCHMSYEVGRRQTIYKYFPRSQIGPNSWPPERDKVLKSCKFALNIHQDQHPFQEPLRFALFAAYGLPIVSETVLDAYPWGEETMVFSGYDSIVSKMRALIDQNYEQWESFGLRAREMMTEEFEFGKMVRKAIEESVFKWR